MLLTLLLPAPAHAVTLPDAWTAAERGGVEARLLDEQGVQAETLKAQAWALVQPKVVAGATYTVNEYPIVLDFASTLPPEFASFLGDTEPTVVSKERYAAWNVSVIQPLFSGQALPLLRGATRTVEASREEIRGQGLALRAGIARVFYGTAVAREAYAVAETAAANARTHASLASTAVDAGTAPPSARLEAQLAVARAERELLGAREARVAAETAFARLTGLPPGSPLELPSVRPLPWADVESALGAARDGRPALRAARLQAQAARMQHVASALDWLPTLDGRFTYNYTENVGFAPQRDMWMVVLDAKWTAWDGGFRLATQRKNASVARMAGLAADRAAQDAEEQVRTLWEKHARAVAGVEAVTREIALAEQNLALAETAFAAGSVTFLQLEDARLGVRAARMAGLVQRMDRDVARLDLLAASGLDPLETP